MLLRAGQDIKQMKRGEFCHLNVECYGLRFVASTDFEHGLK